MAFHKWCSKLPSYIKVLEFADKANVKVQVPVFRSGLHRRLLNLSLQCSSAAPVGSLGLIGRGIALLIEHLNLSVLDDAVLSQVAINPRKIRITMEDTLLATSIVAGSVRFLWP